MKRYLNYVKRGMGDFALMGLNMLFQFIFISLLGFLSYLAIKNLKLLFIADSIFYIMVSVIIIGLIISAYSILKWIFLTMKYVVKKDGKK